MTAIPLDLFQRIVDRATDATRRTHLAGARATAQPVDFDALAADLHRHGGAGAQSLLGAFGAMSKMMRAGGGMLMMGPGGVMNMGGEAARGPQALAAAPGEDALAAAAERIGRPLPEEVVQLYRVGDGGFGPGNGLFPLADLVDRYEDMTGEPFGPKGQDWPKNLLPLFLEDPVLLCLDMDSGAMVAWDPEKIEDEDSDSDWHRSFKPEAPSLAALMDRWLGEPSFTEKLEQERAKAFAEVPQATLDFYAAMTPEKRAEYGLEGDDWEAELRRRFAAGPQTPW